MITIRTIANRSLLLLLAAILTLSAAACGSDAKPTAQPGKLHEVAAGFSVDPPDGWVIGPKPAGKGIRGASAPEGTPGNSDLDITEVKHDGTTADYVNQNLELLRAMYKDLVVIKNEPFTSDSGVVGTVLVMTMDVFGVKLRQSNYFFPKSGGTIISCTFNTEQQGGEAMDAVFEKSAKTFRLEG